MHALNNLTFIACIMIAGGMWYCYLLMDFFKNPVVFEDAQISNTESICDWLLPGAYLLYSRG